MSLYQMTKNCPRGKCVELGGVTEDSRTHQGQTLACVRGGQARGACVLQTVLIWHKHPNNYPVTSTLFSRWPETQSLWNSYYLASGLASCPLQLGAAYKLRIILFRLIQRVLGHSDPLVEFRILWLLSSLGGMGTEAASRAKDLLPAPLHSVADRGRCRGWAQGPQGLPGLSRWWRQLGTLMRPQEPNPISESISCKNLLCAVAYEVT